MKKIKITAVRQTEYADLMELYENKIEHKCDIKLNDTFISVDAKKPSGFCDSAWESVYPFVKRLNDGESNFFDGWMKNPYSAMISCNDGFRPFSFYVEVIDE